jgi:hypothetical protein
MTDDDRSDRPVSGEVVGGPDAHAGPGPRPDHPAPGWPPARAWADGSRTWSYETRPNVPVLGVFLVALGAILLLDAVAPGSVGLLVAGAGVALGCGFLYLRARGGFGLYPGLFLIALSLPNLLVGLGLVPDRDGYSTFLLGAGLLAVAAIRLRDRRGAGWQAWLGGILAAFGAIQIAGVAPAGDLFWAVALIAVGAYAVFLRR